MCIRVSRTVVSCMCIRCCIHPVENQSHGMCPHTCSCSSCVYHRFRADTLRWHIACIHAQLCSVHRSGQSVRDHHRLGLGSRCCIATGAHMSTHQRKQWSCKRAGQSIMSASIKFWSELLVHERSQNLSPKLEPRLVSQWTATM